MKRRLAIRPTPFSRIAVACALWMATTSAFAGPEEDATRLFEEGRALLEASKTAEACAKFEESFAVFPGVGVQYNLARCYERLGRLQSAHTHYLEVVEVSLRAGQKDRAGVAKQRAADLEPRISTLQVEVTSPGPDHFIELDGTPLPPSMWSTPIPLDGGPHEVRATARGRRPFSTRIELAAEGARERLIIPALVPEGADSPPTPPPPARDAASGGGFVGQEILGIAMMGAGAVGLGIGTGFAIDAANKDADADAFCDDTGCDPPGLDLVADAQRSGNVATALFIGGAVVAAAGIVVYVLAPDPARETTSGASLRLRLAVEATAPRLALDGTF